MSVFEAIMLICFGFAWPFSIYRSYVSASNKGKSLAFLIVVFIGYVSGILHKVIYNFDYVVILYVLNACMVCIDAAVYFRNVRIAKNIT